MTTTRLPRAQDVHWTKAATTPTETVAGPPATTAEATTETTLEEDVFALGERCAEAYMQADALQFQALRLLAEFHDRRGWEDTGFSSTAEWLSWRVGIHRGAARERVRTALALRSLPETSRAMERGELSFTKVRALTRVATSSNESQLLDLARAGSAANLERVVRGWRDLDGAPELRSEERRFRSRRLRCFVDTDGMVVVRGRLDPGGGAMLMRALEGAEDALFKADPEEEATRRKADALGLVAERALAAGFGEHAAPLSGSKADRTQVVLHVDSSTLSGERESGRSELEDGTRVSAETSRRAACDASLTRVVHDGEGRITHVGRRTRTVSASLRRALEARDRGCRFPGCGLRFTEAHHVHHWSRGGETSLRNLVRLCRRHHRAVHEGGARVCIDHKQQVAFFNPRGALMSAAPRSRPLPSAGPEPGDSPPRPAGWDGSSRWKRDRKVPWSIEAAAVAALDRRGPGVTS